jgi:hypothetical protein
MPQVIALGLVGGLVWFAWRALSREMKRVGEELNSASRDVTPLEQGKDGIYRPKGDAGK